MSILITGTAGFIGFHVSQHLLKNNKKIIGIDNLNSYYDVNLKLKRLEQLKQSSQFTFHEIDIAYKDSVEKLLEIHPGITHIVHLAAQAGVRYSLEKPLAYADSNLVGQINILELARYLPNLQHLVYASSSSVYGANTKLPFSITDPVEQPISLYAATKRSCELMAYTYSHLFGIPATGLRYFTVYGPWGRPDMSAFLFTKALFEGKEIPVFNQGDMRRNFSYIEDVVAGTVGCLQNPPKKMVQGKPPHQLYNIGNNRSEPLMDFIATLEKHTGKKAKIRFEPMQPGDVKETIADITDATQDFGFEPKTNIDVGLKNFVEWYKEFYNVK